MGMTKTIAEIKKDFEDRGLSFEGGIVPEKPHKMDYIIPLMKDSLRKRAELGTLRKGCEWVHANVISPQLALSQSGFKSEDEYRSYCDNPDYFGEIKWDGCFKYNVPVLLADGTTLPIGEIVEKKLPVEVMSFNEETQSLEPRKVVNWFNNGLKGASQWCKVKAKQAEIPHRIGYDRTLQGNFVTRNHKFHTKDGYTPAESLVKAHAVVYGLNKTQMQVVLGSLMGDGFLSREERPGKTCAVRFSYMQSQPQQFYYEAKQAVFGSLAGKTTETVSGFGTRMYRSSTKRLACLEKLWAEHYVNDVVSGVYSRKRISKELLNKLGSLGLAVWYMDDGYRKRSCEDDPSITNQWSRVSLATNGFQQTEVEVIAEWFAEQGMLGKIHEDVREGHSRGFFFELMSEGSQKFFDLVADYILPGFDYKLPSSYRSRCGKVRWWEDNALVYDLVETSVTVTRPKLPATRAWDCSYSTAYDIEVEGNHNYVANGFLVHNCRSYAVYTPEDGFEFFSRNRTVNEYLFGDYTDQVKGLGSAEFRGFFKKSFVLDAEMVSINPHVMGRIETLTPLQAIDALMALNREDSWKAQEDAGYPIRWHVFDILMFDGVNLMGCPQWERDQCLAKVMAEIARAEKQFNLPQLGWFLPKETFEGNYEQLKAKFDEVIAQGGEGLVIKNRNAPYVANERRSKDRWFKMKRDFNSATGSDIDAFVTGFGLGTEGKGRENLVSSLYLSVYLMPSEEVHEVARVTGLTLEEMQEATVIGADGKPTLNPEWYNRVFTVEGQNFSGREMRLQHARFPNGLRASYRPDKNPGECQLDSAVMNDLIL